MKKYINYFIIFIFTTSCSMINLIDQDNSNSQRNGCNNLIFRPLSNNLTTELTSTNKSFKIKFKIKKISFWQRMVNKISSDYSISIELNNYNNLIEIMWDKSLYVDYNNRSNKIIPDGIMLDDIGKPILPTVIAQHTSVEKTIFPSNIIKYNDGKYYMDNFDFNKHVGEEVQILLAVKIKNKVKNHLYKFQICE